MDITLSKTQQNIIKEARRFLKKECPPEYGQDMFRDEVGFTNELWDKMKAMDWMDCMCSFEIIFIMPCCVNLLFTRCCLPYNFKFYSILI